MDIKITCRACGRTFPLEMVVSSDGRPGYCPFCGEVLAFQYASTFVGTAEQVLGLGREFVRALTLLGELAGGFAIEPESVIRPVQDAVSAQDAKISAPWQAGWPPRSGEPVG